MKTTKTILTILALTTFFYAHGQDNFGLIPTNVKQTSDSIILSTLGTTYFQAVTFDCEESLIHISDPGHFILNACQKNIKTKKTKKKKKTTELSVDFYELKYRLELLENSYYDFEVRIDKNLKLKKDTNLPDCKNSSACNITVDSLAAIDIAIKSGLEKGLGVYNDGLIFDSETKSFQWTIKNHLKQGPDRGELICIDAQTGQRIRTKDQGWMRAVVH